MLSVSINVTVMHHFKRLIFLAITCGTLLLLQGCSDSELYNHLSQRDANLIVATLEQHGIGASRSSMSDDNDMSVSVAPEDFARAIAILDREGLPERKFANLGDVFKGSGLVSSPTQERAQMMYALSQELSHTVSQIDGVLSARVQVVLPNNDYSRRGNTPSSASVFIRYAPSSNVRHLIPQIKSLVANGIAGLSYDNVSVVTVAASSVDENAASLPMGSFMGASMPAASAHRMHWLFAMLAIVVLALLVATAVLWRRQQHVRTYRIKDAQ
ncbi:hypothetical protein R84981_001236 [Carnimonas sp. R-84981]